MSTSKTKWLIARRTFIVSAVLTAIFFCTGAIAEKDRVDDVLGDVFHFFVAGWWQVLVGFSIIWVLLLLLHVWRYASVLRAAEKARK